MKFATRMRIAPKGKKAMNAREARAAWASWTRDSRFWLELEEEDVVVVVLLEKVELSEAAAVTKGLVLLPPLAWARFQFRVDESSC